MIDALISAHVEQGQAHDHEGRKGEASMQGSSQGTSGSLSCRACLLLKADGRGGTNRQDGYRAQISLGFAQSMHTHI